MKRSVPSLTWLFYYKHPRVSDGASVEGLVALVAMLGAASIWG